MLMTDALVSMSKIVKGPCLSLSLLRMKGVQMKETDRGTKITGSSQFELGNVTCTYSANIRFWMSALLHFDLFNCELKMIHSLAVKLILIYL